MQSFIQIVMIFGFQSQLRKLSGIPVHTKKVHHFILAMLILMMVILLFEVQTVVGFVIGGAHKGSPWVVFPAAIDGEYTIWFGTEKRTRVSTPH